MSFATFSKSQMLTKKSANLSKLGYNFEGEPISEYLKIQNLLMSRYHIEQGSMLTIMKEFGIPSSKTMDTLFKEFEISSRTLSDATTLSIEKERSNPLKNARTFVHIWHNTWDNKQVLLRSSLELKLANILDEAKIIYEVECMRLKYFDNLQNTYRIAIPDFYIPSENRIIEVKSKYWLDEENMKSKVKGYTELGFKFSLYLDGVFSDKWWEHRGSNPDLAP